MNPSLEVRWSCLVSRNSDVNPTATLVEIRGLKKSFDNQVVLAGVDLDLRRGHTVALLGVSGSGKSVLMKCVLGLTEPDAGSVRIDGHETVGLGQTERLLLMRKVGVLFQNGALFDSLPVWQNVAFTLLSSRRVSRGCARRVAAGALTRVGLGADVIDLLPGELSGGMQKRVSLARALVGDPEILFLDNPTAGLDPVLTGIIDSSVAASLEHLQAIALVITHDLTSAQRIADRAAFLSEGRIVWEGATGELWRSDLQQIQKFLRASGSHSRHRAG
ncbi:MAG: ATP-binding cassette domain-containing protein [Alphaproteobacteria bacterium]|nr:ATP-binding cassette domain-containing protein [Alphaproteobacteria bacterium]